MKDQISKKKNDKTIYEYHSRKNLKNLTENYQNIQENNDNGMTR